MYPHISQRYYTDTAQECIAHTYIHKRKKYTRKFPINRKTHRKYTDTHDKRQRHARIKAHTNTDKRQKRWHTQEKDTNKHTKKIWIYKETKQNGQTITHRKKDIYKETRTKSIKIQRNTQNIWKKIKIAGRCTRRRNKRIKRKENTGAHIYEEEWHSTYKHTENINIQRN